MNAVYEVLQLGGSLGFLMYGMKLMSDGIQKSAGAGLKHALSLMTGNRFIALLTGMLITMIIQSSGATSVMVISFVNASLITLNQAIGVIFGANIGTTITAWIVALFGFKFNIDAFAVPLVGFGFLLTAIKKFKKESLGQAIMGFGFLFSGLNMLAKVFTIQDASQLSFLSTIQNEGIFSILIAIGIGIIITALLHSSSALTAIIITMAYSKILTWEFSCAMIIGGNIGSTIDAILAAIDAKQNARRVALVHVLFNIAGAALCLIFFSPMLSLVDMLVPGTVESNITYHIAMMHTMFKVCTTIVFLPFVKQIENLMIKIIKSKDSDEAKSYYIEPLNPSTKETAAVGIIRVEKEIADMTDIATQMFDWIQIGFSHRNQEFIDKYLQRLESAENYADQMYEQLSHFIIQCMHLSITEKQLNSLSTMQQIIAELELMTDDCLSVALFLKRSIVKNMNFPKEDTENLIPYVELARQFLQFIRININKHLSEEKLGFANELEQQIDLFRNRLKKTARHRLEEGVDVKSELLYLDLVRQIEKIGDRAFSISELLAQAA